MVQHPPHTHRAVASILLSRTLGVDCIKKRLGSSQFCGPLQVPDTMKQPLPKSTPASAPGSLAEIHPRIMVPSVSCTLAPPRLGLREAKREDEPCYLCTSVSGFVWLEMALTRRTAKESLSGNCRKPRTGPAFSGKMLVAVHSQRFQVAMQDGNRELWFRCADR